MNYKIFVYLFIFSVLILVFMYVNDKKVLDALENDLESVEASIEELKAENKALVRENDRLRYFSLLENEEAMTYFEERGVEAAEVSAKIEDKLIGGNVSDDSNTLVPFEGMDGPMRINKIKVLNHKWVIADFTDGTYWGEVFYSYELNEEGEISLTPEKSFLYPTN